MANKTVISDAEFKTYVEGCAPSTMGTVYMSDDSKYWMFTKEATDKIKAMCIIDDDVQLWIYNGTDWIINRIPLVIDSLTNTSTIDALSANQGKVLNEKIPPVVDNLTSTSTIDALSANQGKVLKDSINSINRFFDYEFRPQSNIPAGTIGTRGWQGTYAMSGTPRSIVIVYVADSTKVLPVVFYYSGLIYCNLYRCVASVIEASFGVIKVRVYY